MSGVTVSDSNETSASSSETPSSNELPGSYETVSRRSSSRGPRSYRRLRRWMRHTPNGTIAVNLVALGLALVLIAGVLAVTIL